MMCVKDRYGYRVHGEEEKGRRKEGEGGA